jgi:hypothetical protein
MRRTFNTRYMNSLCGINFEGYMNSLCEINFEGYMNSFCGTEGVKKNIPTLINTLVLKIKIPLSKLQRYTY